MMKTGKNKRLLASILAASMLLAMSPFALAEGPEDTTGQGQSQSTEGTDPIEWNVSRSKTATALNTRDWTSDVTLSLPSAEEALASDVVFVLDKSTSTELEDQALGMLAALKDQAASTEAKVKVGVVIFNKEANVTPLTDLTTGYDDIQAAIGQTISSGTNTHAGLLAGKQLLDDDTEVAANRKYLIFVSDGITYMYNAEPTATAWSFKADSWNHWVGPDNWNSKYGSDNPPADWSARMTEIGTQVEAQGTKYEYSYGETATNWTPENDDTYKNYANSIDKALYLTYQVYQAAQTKGYNCYAVVNENEKTTAYPWGPAFMHYLANGQTVDFGKIQNDILYAVSAGSTVTDTIGEKFTFGGVDSFTLKVGTEEIKGVKDASDENTVNFGKKKDNGKYPYTVTYAPDTKTFVWTINENVSNFAPVQLTYTVKLTTPETDPGTYGVEDLKGEKELSDAEEEKALFTNESAVLNAINSAGATLNPLDFPKPSVSYTVKNSSGGGTDPIEWNVSRSKTATALDTSTWTSNVTLSLPSAEEKLASDVVFVLDKSTSAALEEQALGMLAALKDQAASTEAKVKVGVVIFNKEANVTPLTDLTTGYDDIQAAIGQTISSGTNTHAGLLAGKQLLDDDTEVAANRKYLIFVSDGITYMYNAEPTATAWSFKADSWNHWVGPDNWNSKYGSDNPPADWSARMTEIGTQVEAQGTKYEYSYGETATNWTPENDDTYKNYANSIDKALYLTYQVYQAAQTKGYNCYAVVNENEKTTAYPWGPAFMHYLANGQTVDFGKIQNDILYAVSAGSTVTDTIGEKFTFGGVDSFTLKVGTEEIKGVKDASDENTVNFGKKKDNGKYPYTVTYAPDTKTFVWTINENVSNFAPVQLTYTVKLTTPETDPGTYGVEDLKGEKDVPSDKALFTNKRAVLNAINSAGAPLNPLDFPKPSVSYTVKKSSGGGGGGGGRKPTVTIPDDVPTGLNGDDHYAYIVGYPNGNVEPNGNITRAEVATIFFRLLTEEVRTANSTQSNSLSDVTRGQWFNHAVSTLSSMGIVKGHNDGTFAPNAPITRAEFAAIAARFDDKNTDTSSKFTDIASHWAKNEIGIAANKGWINGYPDGTFRPNQYITRAEAMTLVNRVLNRLPENSSDLLDSMIKWPDNSDASAWYYLAVQEATNSHYYKTKENKFEKWTELRETRDWTELEK